MKIGVLFRKTLLDDGNLKPEDYMGRAEFESMKVICNSIEEIGHEVEVINPEPITNLYNKKFNLAFNLCDDGFHGNSQLEPHLPALLDILQIPYTGSNYLTLALCLSKPKTKQLLLYNGIRTPKFQIFKTGNEKLKAELKLPLIVKPSREDASIGIRDDSVIHKKKKLKPKILDIISTYKQPALVEGYIEGREFNIGIMGNDKPLVLPLSEILFNLPKNMNKICSYESKWIIDHEAYNGTKPQCPAEVSEKLSRKLTDLALRSYKLMGCQDYGRIDFRVDRFGRPYILEVNPNPDISPNAGLANMASKAGISYTQLIKKIIDYSVERNKNHFSKQKQ